MNKKGKVNAFGENGEMPFPKAGFGNCPGSRAACKKENNKDDFARETETGSRGSDRGVMAPYKESHSKIFLINLHLLHYMQC